MPFNTLIKTVVELFSDLYWRHKAPWTRTTWIGQGVAKCPLDLWVYQEILTETLPDLLIETGTSIGGSALFFASVFDILNRGHVITVDKDSYPNQRVHPRITYLVGSSIDPEIVAIIQARAHGLKVMVALDSLHTYTHVKAELAAYAGLVSPGCYLVVEDTNVDESWAKPAAHAAADEFVKDNPDYEVDIRREAHLLTFNPGGWIRRNVPENHSNV